MGLGSFWAACVAAPNPNNISPTIANNPAHNTIDLSRMETSASCYSIDCTTIESGREMPISTPAGL
jgi:hypothetical protein